MYVYRPLSRRHATGSLLLNITPNVSVSHLCDLQHVLSVQRILLQGEAAEQVEPAMSSRRLGSFLTPSLRPRQEPFTDRRHQSFRVHLEEPRPGHDQAGRDDRDVGFNDRPDGRGCNFPREVLVSDEERAVPNAAGNQSKSTQQEESAQTNALHRRKV